MSRSNPSQRGIAHILAFVLVLVVVGAVGVFALQLIGKREAAVPSFANDTASSVPNKLNNVADVKKVDQALSDTPIDDGVNPNQLDGDLNALL